MYEQSDPRASLASASAAASETLAYSGAEYGRFDSEPPQESDAAGRSWYLRGQNFVLNYIEANADSRFERIGQPDEYAIVLPDRDMRIAVRAGEDRATVEGGSIVFIPPGDSLVVAMRSGRIVRLVTSRSSDLVAKCSNATSYETPHAHVPPLQPWPEAKSGDRIRVYPLEVPPAPGRFGTIHRCSTFMISAIEPYQGPRDPARLSPHHHDDFEQCSLAVEGSFVHHIRWPWTPDSRIWREDEHELCTSPSAVVIPPRAIHTSRGMDAGTNRLIDIFCPPRLDFSLKPGWVLNSGDYPLPEDG